MRAAGFRKDINGLRAWAVLAVVLFHFEIKGLSGGFVRVDVFFVISGYLMMQILMRRVESTGLGLLEFWRSTRRALCVSCLH